ncbi:conserved hypothetical Ustilaginaceae-specific protein [Sporisorium reilianum SRZ2]|uniref:Conserved hypothetical Ustilaginaceae-specific protein n=1 Tax=Sporisorium reilianum (strain SRZ2) TaxID=999809 RepID=E7A095_SPORE|nr:conserved hypothetical Ustilaginaceae-specific protein [Sporisorium reilianum SRZ2]
MKKPLPFLLAALLAGIGVVSATPPMPDAVRAGNDVVRHLWDQASKDSFVSELYPEWGPKTLRWGMFLYNDAEPIIYEFYKSVQSTSATHDLSSRFLRAVRWEDTSKLELTNDVKRRLAMQLIERFAEKERIGTQNAEEARSAIQEHERYPQTESDDPHKDTIMHEHHTLTPPDTSGSDNDGV